MLKSLQCIQHWKKKGPQERTATTNMETIGWSNTIHRNEQFCEYTVRGWANEKGVLIHLMVHF